MPNQQQVRNTAQSPGTEAVGPIRTAELGTDALNGVAPVSHSCNEIRRAELTGDKH